MKIISFQGTAAVADGNALRIRRPRKRDAAEDRNGPRSLLVEMANHATIPEDCIGRMREGGS